MANEMDNKVDDIIAHFENCDINERGEQFAREVVDDCSETKPSSRRKQMYQINLIWFNKECAEAVYVKRRAHKLWRRHKTDHHKIQFKEARASCKNTIDRAKRSQLADETNSEVILYHAKRSKLAYKTNMDETDSKNILDAKRSQLADETNTDETNSKVILDYAKRSQLADETNTDKKNSKVIKRSQLAGETNTFKTNSKVILDNAKPSQLADETNTDKTNSTVILDNAKPPQLTDETNTDMKNSKVILDHAKPSQLANETNKDETNSKVILDIAKRPQFTNETNTDETNSKEIQRLGGNTTCYRWELPTTIFMGKTKYVKYVAKSQCTSFCDNCPCGISRRRTKNH